MGNQTRMNVLYWNLWFYRSWRRMMPTDRAFVRHHRRSAFYQRDWEILFPPAFWTNLAQRSPVPRLGENWAMLEESCFRNWRLSRRSWCRIEQPLLPEQRQRWIRSYCIASRESRFRPFVEQLCHPPRPKSRSCLGLLARIGLRRFGWTERLLQ